MTAGNQPSSSVSAEALARILVRCRTVLGNMAWENEGRLAMFNRWPINHEPLRSDARNLVPLIDEVLTAHHTEAMEGFSAAQASLPPPTAEQLAVLVRYLESQSDRLTKALDNPNWTPRRSHVEGDRNAFLAAANTLDQALRTSAVPSTQREGCK